jgi:hypothetical protein
MSKGNEKRFTRRIQKLAAQNARLREVVESLANRSALQGELASRKASGNTITLFETFCEAPVPRLKAKKHPSGGLSTETAVQDDRWFPRFGGDMGPLDPTPGWRCLTARDAPIRLGFNLIGIDPSAVGEAVAKVERRQLLDRDFIPVFITDQSDFEAFRLRGYVFEYIPPSISTAPKNRRAERSYFKQRLELIKAKWNLQTIVDLSG